MQILTEKKDTAILNLLGVNSEQLLTYMRSLIRDYVLMDMTDIESKSENISLSSKDYDNDFTFNSQFNLIYVYSSNSYFHPTPNRT